MSDHCTPPNPDGCFACKCQYWRRVGAPPAHYQGGRDKFHDSTIPERQRRIVAEAAANGIEARPVHPVYDRPADFGQTAAQKREHKRGIETAFKKALKEHRGARVTTGKVTSA